jgi:hypothetical protein
MGLAGADYITDWQTPMVPNGLYYLKLTVRNPLLFEFESPVVAVRVDNILPSGPSGPPAPVVLTMSQAGRKLICCDPDSVVTRGGGPITIHIEGIDPNFSSLSVDLYRGCSKSFHIFGKTYNGITSDEGAPAPGIDIAYDPWAAGVEPCCYVLFLRIWDRAIVDNFWSGGHENEVWHELRIS